MGLPLFYENQELAKVSVGVAGVAKLCIVQRRTPHPANTRGHPSRPRRAENRKKLSGHTLQSRRRGGQGHGLLRIGGYQFQSRPSKTAAPIGRTSQNRERSATERGQARRLDFLCHRPGKAQNGESRGHCAPRPSPIPRFLPRQQQQRRDGQLYERSVFPTQLHHGAPGTATRLMAWAHTSGHIFIKPTLSPTSFPAPVSNRKRREGDDGKIEPTQALELSNSE